MSVSSAFRRTVAAERIVASGGHVLPVYHWPSTMPRGEGQVRRDVLKRAEMPELLSTQQGIPVSGQESETTSSAPSVERTSDFFESDTNENTPCPVVLRQHPMA